VNETRKNGRKGYNVTRDLRSGAKIRKTEGRGEKEVRKQSDRGIIAGRCRKTSKKVIGERDKSGRGGKKNGWLRTSTESTESAGTAKEKERGR